MVVTDLEYPLRAAHTLIARQLATFDKLNPSWSSSITSDVPYDREPSWMIADLKDWQDPSSQDKITKIQRELGIIIIHSITIISFSVMLTTSVSRFLLTDR